MKKVLVIDDSEIFRNFISDKLSSFGLEVLQAINGFDGIMKLRSFSPDLIIMDYFLSRNSSVEVLERKAQDPNLKKVPVIMASTNVDRAGLLRLSVFGIRHFFSKPIKIDSLVKAVAETLNINLNIDTTPCIIEANYNEEMIIIEVAQGLNRDKIDLLKYRIQELRDLYRIGQARVLLLLTGLKIGADESLLFAGLLNIILEYSQARPRNFKILTNSDFVKKFLKDRETFAEIQAVGSLQQAMDELLGNRSGSFKDENDTVRADFFKSSSSTGSIGVNLRFQGSLDQSSLDLAAIVQGMSIVVVDDDPVIRAQLTKIFQSLKVELRQFEDGQPFLESLATQNFDLVFLDLLMPGTDGFKVLQDKQFKTKAPPVVILSAMSQRETVERALKLGVKSYIIKPVTPDDILKKTAGLLRSNF